jgi:hypothetical protein
MTLVALAGCRCGSQSAVGPSSAAYVWSDEPSVSSVPADGMTASLLGEALVVAHVQIHEAMDGSLRIEIADRAPTSPCAFMPDAQGFSIKLPSRPGKGKLMKKTMQDHPRGVSAFMVQRREDGSTTSVMARDFCLALQFTSFSASKAQGVISMAFDDEDRSGVAGHFEASYCPLR